MSAMLDHVVFQVLTLQVRLLACRERLAADTDSEALHDLRIALRRLRSLMRPLRGLPGVEQLEDAAQALGTLTTPLRDREVLAAQLIQRGHLQAGQRRLEGRARTFASVARSPSLPAYWRFLTCSHCSCGRPTVKGWCRGWSGVSTGAWSSSGVPWRRRWRIQPTIGIACAW